MEHPPDAEMEKLELDAQRKAAKEAKKRAKEEKAKQKAEKAKQGALNLSILLNRCLRVRPKTMLCPHCLMWVSFMAL